MGDCTFTASSLPPPLPPPRTSSLLRPAPSVPAATQKWRKAQFDLEQARKEIGVLQKKVTEAKKAGDNATADEVIATMAELKAAIPAREAGVDEIKKSLDRELNKVPNDVDPGVPLGNDEAKHNTIYREWGECTTREGLLHHHELLWMIDGYEPERGVGVAGHRAYFLKGVGLLLNQALISYGLSFLAAREYTPLMPPFFMNRDVMAGVAQLEDVRERRPPRGTLFIAQHLILMEHAPLPLHPYPPPPPFVGAV